MDSSASWWQQNINVFLQEHNSYREILFLNAVPESSDPYL
jgi:hypothetical protein